MNDKLPNFSRADVGMTAAEGFYKRAAGACDVVARLAERSGRGQEALFIGHAAQACDELSETLAHNRTTPLAVACDTFVQYAPDEPAPADDELEFLRTAAGAEHVLQQLTQLSERWRAIFGHLAEVSESEDATRLNEACGEQVEVWQRKLSTAYARGCDL